MIFEMLFFIVASIYWYITGHFVPAVFGYAFALVFMYDDELYIASYALGILALFSVVYFFYSDYFSTDSTDGIGSAICIIYMLVILIKAKKIFDNDAISLD